MTPRRIAFTLFGLAPLAGLAGCAALEVPVNPGMPVLRMNAASTRPGAEATIPTSATALAAATLSPPSSGTLPLTVESAISLALARNRDLTVDRFDPMIQQTFIAEQRAAFDPVLSGGLTYTRTRNDSPLGGPNATRTGPMAESHSTQGNIGLSEFLPTGTNIDLTLSDGRSVNNNISTPFNATANAGLDISQNLLRGRGLDVNLVSLRQARVGARVSDYQLRAYTQTVVANVEDAYWDYLLAQRQVKIYEDALKVAQQQLDETTERIKVGQLADTERFSAQSEVALRREDLINAHSQLQQAQLTLLRLVSPPGDSLAARPIELLSEPVLPDNPADPIADHLAVALRMRPDLNQARLQLINDDLTLVRTRNGLLPDLQFFVNLGKTGYANSFGNAVRDLGPSGTNSLSTGLNFSYALGNRAAQAQQRRAELNRQQQDEAIANMGELAEQDVRSALIEIERVRAQITATAATRQLKEETLRTEQEKYRVGKSTQLLVAQAERDLLSAQINEVQASTAYLKAIVNLYLQDGSLLARRGVQCPGADSVDLTQPSQYYAPMQ